MQRLSTTWCSSAVRLEALEPRLLLDGTVYADTYGPGFDPADATVALQGAINSGADTVIVRDMGSPWYVTPIFLASNQHIIFENSVTVQAKPGAFTDSHASLFTSSAKTNIWLEGYGATLLMNKAEYIPLGGEWRHGLNVLSSSYITVQGLTIQDTGGDGIYLGKTGSTAYNTNIYIKDVTSDGNYRQGLSIISVDGLLVEDSQFTNTSGTPPSAGIDLEPNAATQRLAHIDLRNVTISGNSGWGILVWAYYLNNTSEPISMSISSSTIEADGICVYDRSSGAPARADAPTGDIYLIDVNSTGGYNIQPDMKINVHVDWTPPETLEATVEPLTIDGVTVDFVRYPLEPNHPAHSWSEWGKGLVHSNGKIYTAIGDHNAPQTNGLARAGKAYLYEYDPQTKLIRCVADLNSAIPDFNPLTDWGNGKMHGRVLEGADGMIYFGGYWGYDPDGAPGRILGNPEPVYYQGDNIFWFNPVTEEIGVVNDVLGQVTIPMRSMPSTNIWAEGGIFYAETTSGDGTTDRDFLVYDLNAPADEAIIYLGDHDYQYDRAFFVDANGDAWFSAGPAGDGTGMLQQFDISERAFGVLASGMPGMQVRQVTRPDANGYMYGTTLDGRTLFRFDPATLEFRSILTTEADVASLELDPTGQYLYYYPGSTGDYSTCPLFQVDVSDIDHPVKRTVVELRDDIIAAFGYHTGGSYSMMISPDGQTVYVQMNINWGYSDGEPAFVAIHIPQSAPAAPTDLAANVLSSRRIALSWTDNATDERQMLVQRSSDGVSGWTTIATLNHDATSYTNVALDPGTTYYYRVAASNVTGDSYSDVVIARTMDPMVPDAPSGLTATTVSISQINLAWTNNADNETGFRVERMAEGAGTWTTAGTTVSGVTTFSDTGLADGVRYYYRVFATNAVGDSVMSNAAGAATIDIVATLSETWTGANGTAWPTRWTFEGNVTGVQTKDIQNNRGRVLGKSASTGAVLAYVNNQNFQNIDATVEFTISASGMGFGMIARRADGNNDTYYYTQVIYNNNTASAIRIFSMVDGVATELVANTTTAGRVTAASNYKMRFYVMTNSAGTTDLKVKLWLASAQEPTTWTAQVTNGAALLQGVSGRMGLRYVLNTTRNSTEDNLALVALEIPVDTTPPVVTVNPIVTADRTPELSGTINDPTAAVEVQVIIDGRTYIALNDGITWVVPDNTIDPLADGVYDVRVTATDPANNVGHDLTSYELTVDAPPVVTVDPLLTADSSPQLTGTVDDPNAAIVVTVDGQAYEAVNNGLTWTLPDDAISPLADGIYDVLAAATDAGGNVGYDATAGELIVDTMPPAVTVDPLLTSDRTPQLTGTVDDPNAAILVTVDGQSYAAVNHGDTWMLPDDTIVPLVDGIYDVLVAATDAAGNVGYDSTSDELTVDATPPAVTVDPLLTADNTPQLTGTVDDPNAAIVVTVDGQSYEAVNNGLTWTLADDSISPLADGIYDVLVAATDAAGNVGYDATSGELIVDTTPPAAPFVDLDAASDSGLFETDNITNDNTPTFTGTAEAASTVRLYDGDVLLGSTTASSTGQWAYTAAMADGVHSITATAADVLENVSMPSEPLSVTIDTVAPVVTLASPADAAVFALDEAVAADYQQSDELSGIALHSGPPDGADIDTATLGSKSFEVSATDLAGNSTTVTHNYEVKQPASLAGYVWEDFNDDGEINFGERAVGGVTVTLTGTNNANIPVSMTTTTDEDGMYAFASLRPGTYTIAETQPAGYVDGQDIIGTLGGGGSNDAFAVTVDWEQDGMNYNFGERPLAGATVTSGQTATIGFWQNKNGQALLKALNGSAGSTQLGDWLAATLSNMYGISAGANNLAGKTNAEVAAFYVNLFKKVPGPKVDAQAMAVALAAYVTNSTLAGNVAASYGFLVTAGGVGVATWNVGACGAAFGVANDTEMTVLDILLATDAQAVNGALYNLNAALRTLANRVYSAINEGGDI